MTYELVEDFEGLPTNQTINGKAGSNGQVWKTVGSGGVEQRFKVKTLDGQKVLWCSPTPQDRAYLPLAASISSGRTVTLYFRIRYTSAGASNFSVGLSDEAVPGTSASAVTVALTTETGPSISANLATDRYRLQIDTWYRVWAVVDLADSTNSQKDDSYRLYFQDEVSGVVTQVVDSTRSGADHTDFLLRSYTTGTGLLTFAIHATRSRPFYVDDVYVDLTGENLADPSTMLTLVNRGSSDYWIVYENQRSSEANEIATRYQAALILQEFIQNATGKLLPIMESQQQDGAGRPVKNIFVGDSDYVRNLGEDFSDFSSETSLVWAINSNLVLAGLDGVGDPWYLNSSLGNINTPTLHAVSRFLELFVGARWFWPGPLGEVYTDLTKARLDVPRSTYLQEAPSSSIRAMAVPWYYDTFMKYGFNESFARTLETRYCRWHRLNRLGTFDRMWHDHSW
ncbi:MAG: hypothetical protein ACKO8I_02305, partial [Cyanobacteriota bacterium]